MNTGTHQTNPLYKVKFQPIGKSLLVSAGESLLDSMRSSGIDIIALCGGIGSCDSCKVRVISGEVSTPSISEQGVFTQNELLGGYRLACQVHAYGDLVVEILPESLSTPQRLLIEGHIGEIEPSPVVKIIPLQIQEPSLSDLRSDAMRIKDELRNYGIGPDLEFDYGLLQDVSSIIRKNQWKVSIVINGNRIISVLPPDSSIYGLAVDIGTTKIAAYLVDLISGTIIVKGGRMNPQISFGEDVISRIAYANQTSQGSLTLQNIVIKEINYLLDTLIESARDENISVEKENIVDAVVVGNTAMHHLFAGLPVRQLGTSPYVAATTDPLLVPARELGLQIAKGARIFLPPIIAGYIGPDHVAMLVSTEVYKLKETCLAMDIGTNTEITLSHEGKLYSCSCASGPAFEGAHIRAGMRASNGAIERIKISGDKVYISTIGSSPPIGICGSGILDAVSELLSSGLLNQRGGFRSEHVRIMQVEQDTAFMLETGQNSGSKASIYITRKDINEIQLAKGAIRAGIEILLREAGIQYQQIKQFFIAGAFGSYLNIDSAINIGMFPELAPEKFHQTGNSAGVGAVLLLLSSQLRGDVEDFSRNITYVELSNHPLFSSEFGRALLFDHALQQ